MLRSNLSKLFCFVLICAGITLTSQSYAAEADSVEQEPIDDKIARGETLAAPCAACHGANGVAVIAEYPNLASQVRGYIATQLALFKSGERQNALMAGQVANLSEQDMDDLDAYFSSLEPADPALYVVDENDEEMIRLATMGQKLYRGGQKEYNIPSCMSCHGPTAAGIPSQYPRISQMSSTYLENTLLAYKSGTRVNDVMNTIGFRLSEEQIKALSIYINAITKNTIQEQ